MLHSNTHVTHSPVRWESPLYIQSHTASVLFAAVERDTNFLASHTVMDYSLLLGVEDNTLVLGIIGKKVLFIYLVHVKYFYLYSVFAIQSFPPVIYHHAHN